MFAFGDHLDNDQVPFDNQEEIRFDALSAREKRALIFHFLYAAEAFDYQISLEALVDNFNRGFNLNVPLSSDIVTCAQEIINQREELDELYKPLLSNWRFDRIGVCTKLILRFAIWELRSTEIPSTIIINEAIELAKSFAEQDAYKFINGILDEAVKKLPRPGLPKTE